LRCVDRKVAFLFPCTSVIAFGGAFHGRTFLGMSLTGKVQPYKAGFGAMMPDIYHVPFPIALHGVSVSDAMAGITKLFKTLKAGGKELLRTLVGYEVGAMFYTLLYGSVAIPFAGAAIAMAGAAIGGIVGATLFKKAFGSSVEE
jgi:hypothetical protein